MTEDNKPEQPSAPNMRSFSMNSPEGHAALCYPRDEAWIPNGSLPREPRGWDISVIVETRRG